MPWRDKVYSTRLMMQTFQHLLQRVVLQNPAVIMSNWLCDYANSHRLSITNIKNLLLQQPLLVFDLGILCADIAKPFSSAIGFLLYGFTNFQIFGCP